MAGRPLTYKTVEELQEAIDQYFADCQGELVRDENGNPMLDKWGRPIYIHQRPPTITGLALALGFNSRQALINYQVKKQFNDTITRAKARVEEYAEQRLFDRDGTRGAEFSLKCNFKWNDRQPETEATEDGVSKAASIIVAMRKTAAKESGTDAGAD